MGGLLQNPTSPKTRLVFSESLFFPRTPTHSNAEPPQLSPCDLVYKNLTRPALHPGLYARARPVFELFELCPDRFVGNQHSYENGLIRRPSFAPIIHNHGGTYFRDNDQSSSDTIKGYAAEKAAKLKVYALLYRSPGLNRLEYCFEELLHLDAAVDTRGL